MFQVIGHIKDVFTVFSLQLRPIKKLIFNQELRLICCLGRSRSGKTVLIQKLKLKKEIKVYLIYFTHK